MMAGEKPAKKVAKALGIDAVSLFGPLGWIFRGMKKMSAQANDKPNEGKVAPHANIKALLDGRGIQVDDKDDKTYEEAVQKKAAVLLALMLNEALKANNTGLEYLGQRKTIVVAGLLAAFVDIAMQFAHVKDDAEFVLKDTFTILYSLENADMPLPVDVLCEVGISQYQFGLQHDVLRLAYIKINDAVYNYLADFSQESPAIIYAGVGAMLQSPIITPIYEDQVDD